MEKKRRPLCIPAAASIRPHLYALFCTAIARHARVQRGHVTHVTYLTYLTLLIATLSSVQIAAANADYLDLQMPKPGDHTLHILAPNLLELVRVNSKQPN